MKAAIMLLSLAVLSHAATLPKDLPEKRAAQTGIAQPGTTRVGEKRAAQTGPPVTVRVEEKCAAQTGPPVTVRGGEA
ncbi:hypothetical protein OPT61_g8446 [Boeremia exigua]|uniref:Uncharacterized protein n=1 Tax=Boeremia exigua TaxID=749465 RepID=A0ACC2HYJ7_9PLEO|nr:hypothetical protein OPT61_g8446 [Boeremia exigua]